MSRNPPCCLEATQMLPATWSNVGFGIFGRKYTNNRVYAYEVYLTNGFDDRIINNTENRTFLAATKENKDRFEESFNGSMLTTVKAALRNKIYGEIGLPYMGGVYNKFKEDGLVLDNKRRVDVFAIDFNTTLPFFRTQRRYRSRPRPCVVMRFEIIKDWFEILTYHGHS